MPKQPKERKLSLYKALKVGYLRDEAKQAKALKRFGFQLDTRISDGRQTMVAYNPAENKVLFVENGTDPRSLKDLDTDLSLAGRNLKKTTRFREAKAAYDAAKAKYKGASFVDAGHSLGAGLINELIQKGDQGYTYNPAILDNINVKRNLENYRTRGDAVSVFAPKQTTTQLVNANSTVRPVNYLLKAHALENIKDLPVFV
jgi:hypothetical protein